MNERETRSQQKKSSVGSHTSSSAPLSVNVVEGEDHEEGSMTRRSFSKGLLGGALVGGITLSTAGVTYETNHLEITSYEVIVDTLPPAFTGLRIAHISDFHNKTFFPDNEPVEQALSDVSPDLVVITGDIIDRNHYHPERAYRLVASAAAHAPVYYCTGNHEHDLNSFDAVMTTLSNEGARVLRNESVLFEKGGTSLLISGIDDPQSGIAWEETLGDIKREAKETYPDLVTLLLSHRPERFGSYVSHGFDLVFCGHAHGGGIRLPLLGPLYAPEQGMFPTYTQGTYLQEGTTMVVSRGIGNSRLPLRIGNKPEVVVVDVKRAP